MQSELLEKIRGRQALVGVIGLGYVGLPLSIAFGEAGVRVLGFDTDPAKAAALEAGESYISSIAAERVASLSTSGMLAATADLDRLGEPDALLICVPTPLTAHLEPDLSFVTQTTRSIAERLRPGQLVVLESTTYPGTTAEVLKPILEATGMRSGEDFFIAYSPEREDPGNIEFSTTRIPKVVGADDAPARDIAMALYDHIVKTVPVSSMMTAEAVKITENVFRAVNIALVNELKVIYSAMGVDVWEVIDAAKTKPFGYMPFYPGPGLGGHCIPIDPFYLTWKAREFNRHTKFIELAGEINAAMPDHVVGVLAEALDRRFAKGLNGSKILIVGLAYKKNVNDTRESPALRIMELIEERGADVAYHDPFVPSIPPTRRLPGYAGRESTDLAPEIIAGFDAVLIATDHDGVDYRALVDAAPLVVDTRNACARAGAPLDKVVAA